jgi:hypothetical protein
VFVHALSGAASFAACLRLFRSYPLAVSPWSADGASRSIVLRYPGADDDRASGKNGFFVLSQDRAEHFVLRPWACGQAGNPAGSRRPGGFRYQEIRPVDRVPAAVHQVIAEGMPVPRDGALLGWVPDRCATTMLSVHHAISGPQVRVLPLAGSEPLDWPPFAADPLADGRLWEYIKWGEIVDLAPLLARHPRRVFWVPSQNRSRAADAHGCVVVRESMSADGYWLAEGVYMDHWILREAVPVAPSEHLLTLPGTVDLASCVSVG